MRTDTSASTPRRVNAAAASEAGPAMMPAAGSAPQNGGPSGRNGLTFQPPIAANDFATSCWMA